MDQVQLIYVQCNRFISNRSGSHIALIYFFVLFSINQYLFIKLETISQILISYLLVQNQRQYTI